MENLQFQSENISNLAKALILVQKALQPAVKDSTNPFAKSKYASLNSVMEVCRGPLIQNGIWLCQYPVPVDGDCLGLTTKLTHAESGEWQSSLTVVPLPKSDPQGMGSALTYARRYSLSAMLGIVTEDDDGEQATIPKNRSAQIVEQKSTWLKQSEPVSSNVEPDKKVTNSENPKMGAGSACPKIDGISYEEKVDEQGQVYFVAVGNTLAKKSILSASGFRWDTKQKLWYKLAS